MDAGVFQTAHQVVYSGAQILCDAGVGGSNGYMNLPAPFLKVKMNARSPVAVGDIYGDALIGRLRRCGSFCDGLQTRCGRDVDGWRRGWCGL